MNVIDYLTSPFADYAFMRRALAAAWILAIGGTPLGVFMMLRRMTLVGDALSHAILPGVACAFLVAGFSLWAMSLGGLVAALLVAMAAGFLVRTTQMKEDAAFSFLYLFSLAAGVMLISLKGSSVNLLHLLFGNILAIDEQSLLLVTGVSCFSIFMLCAFYRRFIVDGFDPDFLAVMRGRKGGNHWTAPIFYALLMINLVAAFQALGTLMALGLMLLPALSARFWVRNIDRLLPLSIGFALLASYAGLLLSFYSALPAGPAIVLCAASLTFVSLLLGPVGSVRGYFKNSL